MMPMMSTTLWVIPTCPLPKLSAQCHDLADTELVLDLSGAVLFDPRYIRYLRSTD